MYRMPSCTVRRSPITRAASAALTKSDRAQLSAVCYPRSRGWPTHWRPVLAAKRRCAWTQIPRQGRAADAAQAGLRSEVNVGRDAQAGRQGHTMDAAAYADLMSPFGSCREPCGARRRGPPWCSVEMVVGQTTLTHAQWVAAAGRQYSALLQGACSGRQALPVPSGCMAAVVAAVRPRVPVVSPLHLPPRALMPAVITASMAAMAVVPAVVMVVALVPAVVMVAAVSQLLMPTLSSLDHLSVPMPPALSPVPVTAIPFVPVVPPSLILSPCSFLCVRAASACELACPIGLFHWQRVPQVSQGTCASANEQQGPGGQHPA